MINKGNELNKALVRQAKYEMLYKKALKNKNRLLEEVSKHKKYINDMKVAFNSYHRKAEKQIKSLNKKVEHYEKLSTQQKGLN